MSSTVESDYYMKMDMTPYIGEWIAIHGKEVVAHARSFGDVHSMVSKIMDPSTVLFVPVRDSDSLIL
ncbi:hypothetical protein AUP07_0497 [methanogenic archaeon mixed culture ISO4-G1]|nr:hypothetical protein AUP07_0497 [methanogenic archaeon mixed culture ISO4-G1]